MQISPLHCFAYVEESKSRWNILRDTQLRVARTGVRVGVPASSCIRPVGARARARYIGLSSSIFGGRVQVLRRRVQKWSYAPPRGAEVVYACSTEYSSAAAYGRGRPGFPAQASELCFKSDFRLNTDFGMKLKLGGRVDSC